MTPPEPAHSVDLTAAPRAILRESVRLLYRVFGEKRLRTAQGNAWAALCADRERASQRAEVNRLLAAARKPALNPTLNPAPKATLKLAADPASVPATSPADHDLRVMIARRS
jgi:hypothetical protein